MKSRNCIMILDGSMLGTPRSRSRSLTSSDCTARRFSIIQSSLARPRSKSASPLILWSVLGVPVVSNFRPADLAAGGQGAPLATAFHLMIFGRKNRHVCVNNLGGIINVTSIDLSQSASRQQIRAFDTGPGNVLIDLAMRELTSGRERMDRNGKRAREGKPNEQLLTKWLRHPFFLQPPPKSTGREMFGEPFFAQALGSMKKRKMSPFDIVRTLTDFTARSIALNYSLHLPSLSLVVLTGGGAANPVLVEAIHRELRQLARGVEVTDSEAFG